MAGSRLDASRARGDTGLARGPALATLLVPTDFSACGLAAVPYAYALAADGGTVHLLHVMVEEPIPNPLYAHYTPGRAHGADDQARQLEALRARLDALVPESARARGVRSVPHVIEAEDVAEQVCALAEELDVDAICLGTHGRTGLARALAGSVTMRVLDRTRRQVLLLRPAA